MLLNKKGSKNYTKKQKRLYKTETYLRIWLYLAKRSERQGAPVLICVTAYVQ